MEPEGSLPYSGQTTPFPYPTAHRMILRFSVNATTAGTRPNRWNTRQTDRLKSNLMSCITAKNIKTSGSRYVKICDPVRRSVSEAGLFQTNSTHQFACEFTYFSLWSIQVANGHSTFCEWETFVVIPPVRFNCSSLFNKEVSFCPFTSYHHSLFLFSTAGSKPAILSHAHCQTLSRSFRTVELISDRIHCLSAVMKLRTVATDNSHLSYWIQNKGGIFNSTVI